jgi:ABC-type uncharacterized transport system substrate-binding protein
MLIRNSRNCGTFWFAISIYVLTLLCHLPALATGTSASCSPAGVTEILFFNSPQSPLSFLEFDKQLKKNGTLLRHNAIVRFVPVDWDQPASMPESIINAYCPGPQIFVAPSVLISKQVVAVVKDKPVVFHTRVDGWDAGLLQIGIDRKNTTGTSNRIPLEQKHLEFWRDISLGFRNIGVVVHRYDVTDDFLIRLRRAAKTLNLNLELFIVSDADEFRAMLKNKPNKKIGAWYMPSTFLLFRQVKEVLAIAKQTSNLISVEDSTFFEYGALVAIESESLPYIEKLAKQVEFVLQGIPPNRIPIERPREVRTILNLEKIKELKIVIPASILRQATYDYLPYN